MATMVYLRDTILNTNWFLRGTAVVTYTGSGTPWNTRSTTPCEIANNDVTGERFVLAADPGVPFLDGGPPFNDWPGAAGFARGNRTIAIPLQLRSSSESNTAYLLSEFRNFLNRMIANGTSYLVVQYPNAAGTDLGTRAAYLGVVHAAFQEGAQFWGDEQSSGVLRGVLTLACTVGLGDNDAEGNSGTLTNATATSAVLSSTRTGDRRGTGQPLAVLLTTGGIATAGTKIIYAASVRNQDNSSVLSSSLATSSSTASTATGNVTSSPSGHRRTSMRWLAEITTASANLEVRIRVQASNSSGQVRYDGPWVTGTGTTNIFDLGYLTSPVYGTSLYATVQFRSAGGAASGTLTRIRALEYYEFCRLTPSASTATNDRIAWSVGSPAGMLSGPIEPYAEVRNSSGAVTQACEVRGQLPRCYDGMSLWVAWTNNGAYTSGATTNAATTHFPLFETLGVPEQTLL